MKKFHKPKLWPMKLTIRPFSIVEAMGAVKMLSNNEQFYATEDITTDINKISPGIIMTTENSGSIQMPTKDKTLEIR